MHRSRTRVGFALFVFLFLLGAFASRAACGATSLRFHGNGSGDIDRVKVPIDDPADSNPGPPADVGAIDFTLEFWMKAAAADNGAGAVTCGANQNWRNGNVVVDRDRQGGDRKFGVSIAGGKIVFGVSGDGTGDLTLCGIRGVLDSLWHHVAVQRRRSDGRLWIYVDGILDAQNDGPNGDVSYPDNAAPAETNDPFLVFGAEKHDAGPAFPSYDGFLDEIRISKVLRYAGPFTRPVSPFGTDTDTVALYHVDEGTGDVIGDSSGAPGGPSDGTRSFGGSPAGPEWSSDGAPLGGQAAITFSLVANTLSVPVFVTHAPGDATRLFVVEQTGAIRIVKNGNLLATAFLNIANLTSDGSEEGLLSVAFDPDYATSGLFYIYYTNNIANPGDITLARYHVSANPDVADPNSAEIVLVVPHPTNANHNGGLLMFGPDGYLYMGTGDGGSGGDPPNNAQNKDVLLGKLLRLDVNGTGAVPCGQSTPMPYAIPPLNPFVGAPGCDEIWAYGLRNPWRWSFDRENGDLLIGDVGQDTWEEIDYTPAASTGGENYGWRVMEATHCYPPGGTCDQTGLQLPIFEYGHGLGCSVTGGFRYRGTAIPDLYGTYLYGDFCTGRIWRGVQDGSGAWASTQLVDSSYSISSWGEDDGGEMYLVDRNGSVYRLTQTPNPAPVANGLNPAAVIAGDPDFTLTVNGSSFVYGSVVRWNGQDRPTNFVSPTQVTASIPANDILAAGSAQVAVFSPAPGGGLTASRTLDINPTFLDVPTSYLFYPYIQAIFDAGITGGCGGRFYCPARSTTRGQMAVFLLRASQPQGYAPPACVGTFFTDVLCTGQFDAWIEDIASRQITNGCGGGKYCPTDPTNRQQIAVFLLRMKLGAGYVPPDCTGLVFTDVHCTGGFFDPWIEDLSAKGITNGCGVGLYCPYSSVTRAQIAKLLVNTFGIPLP